MTQNHHPITPPPELGPAAQAVDRAIADRIQLLGEIAPSRQVAAAALRAAAHEVAPFPGRYPMNEYMEGFRDAKQSVHHQLLAIAAELEAVQ